MAATSEWRWALLAMVFFVASVPLCNGEPGQAVEVGSSVRGNVQAREAELRVDVKFRAGEFLDAPLQLLPPELRTSVESIQPLVTLDTRELERIGASHMARWFRFTLNPGTDLAMFVAALKVLDTVEVVERAPQPSPPPTMVPPESGGGASNR
jgi:hypothetical protein